MRPLRLWFFPALFIACTVVATGPVIGQAPVEPFQRELQAIAEGLEKYRKAGEAELATQQEDAIRDMLKKYAESLDETLARALEERKSPLLRQIEVAEQEIEKLREAGDTATADQLNEALTPLRKADQTGTFAFKASDGPEVHMVHVHQGVALPKELGTKDERVRLGFAQINVNYTARPVVLVLQSPGPTRWKVNLGERARVHDVLLISNGSSDVVGLEGTLVVPSPVDARGDLSRLTGRPTASAQRIHAYDGSPIVIGAKNKEWLASYLEPAVNKIADKAKSAREHVGQIALDHLRFPALFFGGQPHSSRGPGFPATSYGEFTVAGPIAGTLRPTKYERLRQFVKVDDSQQVFVLDEHHRLSVYKGDMIRENRRPAVLPPSAEIGNRRRYTSIAYDTKRKRLMVCVEDKLASRTREQQDRTKGRLVPFDIIKGEWQESVGIEKHVYGLTYDAKIDGYYGLSTSDHFNRKEKTKLLVFDANGKKISDVEIDVDGVPQLGTLETQLVAVDNYVVVLGPRFIREASTGRRKNTTDRLFVVEPKTGRILYSGSVNPHDGSHPIASLKTKKIDGTGILARIDNKLAEAKTDIESLKRTDPQRAAILTSKLQQCRDLMGGKLAKRKEPKLHVVGSYDSHSSRVRVTDTSGPVILALCSYEPASWTIEKAEDVDLQRIIVGGHHKQTVNAAPEGVPLENYCSKEGGGGFQAYSRDDDSYIGTAKRLKDLTSLDISTFLGRYQLNSIGPIQVGPQNGAWLAQEIVIALDKLLDEVNLDENNETLAELRKHKFYAVHHGSFPNQAVPQNRGREETKYLNQFTIDGPLIGRGEKMEGRFGGLVAFDPKGQTVYAMQGDRIVAVNLKTGATTPIPWDNELPRLSWQSGLAYDSKRDRLLLTSFGGGGFLYSFDLTKESWSVLRRPGIGNKGMVYAFDEDAIYGINHDMGNGQIREIRRFNPHGAMIDRIPLSRPLQSDRRPRGGAMQFAYLPGYLAIIDSPQQDRLGRQRPGQESKPKAAITVVNVRSGEIVYEGKLTPVVERKELTEDQISRLWDRLVSADPDAQRDLVWDLAAGHEATMRFLSRDVLLSAKQDAFELAKLRQNIDQLNANKFSTRDAAFDELRNMGSQIVPQLESFLETDISPETKQRLLHLIESWRAGKPQNDAEKVLTLAVEVIAHVGTAEAKQVLRKVAAEGVPVVAARAQKKLSPPADNAD